MSSGPLDDLMQTNRCSFTGFDRDVIPSKAIVRTPEGDTELVSFDRGWDVFSGKIAGELVAVCLGPEAVDRLCAAMVEYDRRRGRPWTAPPSITWAEFLAGR